MFKSSIINGLKKLRGAWGAQSFERLTSVQITIAWFVSWSPTSGSLLSGAALDPPSLPALLLPHSRSLSLSPEQINIKKIIIITKLLPPEGGGFAFVLI